MNFRMNSCDLALYVDSLLGIDAPEAPSNVLLVQNIPLKHFSVPVLRDHVFLQYGPLKNFKLLDVSTSDPSAIVVYEHLKDAKMALESINNSKILGKHRLHVQYVLENELKHYNVL